MGPGIGLSTQADPVPISVTRDVRGSSPPSRSERSLRRSSWFAIASSVLARSKRWTTEVLHEIGLSKPDVPRMAFRPIPTGVPLQGP